MRTFYSYRRPTFLWLSMFLIAFSAIAQDFHSGDNSMQYNNSASPSGNSGFSGAAANVSVNLYTGGLEASLPLYTLKGSDLQIPISINYTASNGVRNSDPNTVVGMDWTLSAGGSISRVVKGLPDEVDNGYIGMANMGLTVVGSFNTPSNSGAGNFNNNRRKRVSNLPPLDGEPDIFSINTPYFSARFTIDQNGNVVFQSNNGLVVTHHLFGNSNGGALGLTVTDDQGTQYFFGTQPSTQEYTTTKFFGTSFTFISTWYLEKIVLLNSKDVITFSYRTDNSDTVYSTLLSKNFTSTFAAGGFPPAGDPTGTSNVAVRVASISNVIYNSPKYLSQITTKLGEADFTYTDNSNSAINSSNPPELTSIVIKQFDPIQNTNVTIRTFNLAYTEIETGITGWTVPFPYPDIWSDYYRRLLNSITLTGNTPATSTPVTLFNLIYYQSLPYVNKALAQNSDYWGYVNTTAFNPDGSTADAYFFTTPDPGRWPAIYNDPPGGTIEVPTAAIFALKEVDALGGAGTVITYSPNDYYNGSYNQSAGGTRVSNLAQKLPTGESYSTGYLYTDASGHSTGQLWSDLYKRIRMFYGTSCCNYNTLAFSMSPYGIADDAGVMLGYSSVKTVNSNGGYEISQFTNFSDYPDVITPPSLYAGNSYNSTYGTNVSLQLSSFSYRRGLLKSHVVYKSNNDKVSEEINTYGSLDAGPVATAIGFQDMTWFLDNNNYLESINIYHSNAENWRLTQTVHNEYDQKTPTNFFQTITNYTYCPNKRQVRSVSAVDSRGYTSSSTFYHADDAGIPLVTTAEQNALNTMITPAFNCVSLPVHQTENRNGVIHQTHKAYSILQYGYNTYAYLNNTDQYTGSTLTSQKIFKYDPTSFNLVSTRSTGGRVTTYQYGYHSSVLVATVAGAENVYTPATNIVPLFTDLQMSGSSASATFSQAGAGNIILRIDGATGYTYSVNYYLSGPSTQSGTLCCQRSATTCSGSYPETVTFSNMPAGTYSLSISLANGSPPYKGVGCTYQGLQGSTTVTPGFYYDGFEENYNYGATVGSAHTGNGYYDGSGTPYYVGFTIPDSRSYIIQWWNWSNGKWKMNQQPYTGPMNISGVIDDVRVFPSDAMMTTATYNPLIGQTGKLAMDGRAMTYEYDGLGRANIVRDQDKYILSKTCYSYSGQAISCPAPTIYYNTAQSGTYNRSNCGVDNLPGSVTYTVPANIYASSISQADADQQARNDVHINAQAYANANGTCTQIYYNAAQSRSFTRNNCLAGYTPGTVTYSVAARAYSSLISQGAADALATNDINTNGQNYANANGTCTPNAVVKYGDLSIPGGSASVTFTTAIIGNINLTPDGATGYTYSLNYYLTGPATYSGSVCAQRSSTTCSYPASATITNAPAGTYTLTVSLGSGSPPFKGMSYNYYGNP